MQRYRIITQYGDMLVVRQQAPGRPSAAGEESPQQHHQPHHQQHHQHHQQPQQPSRPVIMTFHDLGLNSELQFGGFCERDEVKLMLQTFTMLHVNFIGQEPHAERLPADFRYPTCEQLAECIVDVCAHLRLRSFVALGVGAGAHVAALVALQRPDLVDGLFLINPVASSCSITEWLYFKMSAIAGGHKSAATKSNQDHPDTPSPPQSGTHHAHLAHQKPQGGGGGGGGSRLRKLLEAAHLHQRRAEAGSEATPTDAGDASPTSRRSPSPSATPATPPSGGPRLRRLILSRNFRLAASNASAAAATATAGARRDSNSSAESGSQQSGGGVAGGSGGRGGGRPPLEYLLYHHFGSAGLHRLGRRASGGGGGGSGTSSPGAGSQTGSAGPASPARSRPLSASARSQDSLAGSLQGGEPRPRAGSLRGLGTGGGTGGTGSPAHSTPPPSSDASLALSTATTPGSPASAGHAHLEHAYRRHFGSLDAHNLWLFAHSFAKRRSLALRKDCGAAAHAAAAAAALGTSICTAFVGTAATAAASGPAAAGGGGAGSVKGAGPGADRELVAGTKVRRALACQTLVMCSSVGLHGERARRLMALLNPLRATCIQSDRPLVLEERPEKVCQALRLFLQGIGYSMSTYERRLRLSSRQAGSSASSSADSSGSASGEPALPAALGAAAAAAATE